MTHRIFGPDAIVQIMIEYRDGEPVSEIARRRFCSEGTIRQYIRNYNPASRHKNILRLLLKAPTQTREEF